MGDDQLRIHRLLRILTLIHGDRTLIPDRLCQILGTQRRTLFRDLRDLKEAGYPIDFDREAGGYVVARDCYMAPVELTLDESLALTCLAEQLGRNLPYQQPAARAIEKIRSRLPAKLRDALGQVTPHVHLKMAAGESPEQSGDVYELVRQAIAHRRAVECRYASASRLRADAPCDETFRFEPYALFYGVRAWYAIAFHAGRGEVRRLKLSRFVDCRATESPYAIPGDFSLRRELGQAWRMIRGDTRYRVAIRFTREVAHTVEETHWHDTQYIDYDDNDGSVTFHCDVDGLDEIVWWVLGYGPEAEVFEPVELRERVAELARRTVEVYANSVKMAQRQ